MTSEEKRAMWRVNSAKYRATHADEVKRRQAAYRALHSEERSARRRAIYQERKDFLKAQAARWLKAHPEQRAATVARWKTKHPGRALEIATAWRVAHPKEVAAAKVRYKRKHPARHNAAKAKRKAVLLRATPAWANQFFIEEIYELARLRTQQKTGGIAEWQVDHIVPLQSKKVCGLHVEHNLQVISRRLNEKKGNRSWPGMAGADHVVS